MTKHFVWALPSTAIIAFLEFVVTVSAGSALAGPLGSRTGAVLDPARLVSGLVELSSTEQLGPLARAAAIGLALLASWLILEPFLFVLYVRNHETHSRRGPMKLDRRAIRVVALRLLVAMIVGVVVAIAYACGAAAHVVLDRLTDPRPRDVVVALLALVALGFAAFAYLVGELATIRLAIRNDTLLESLIEGHRALDRRTFGIRLVTALASASLGTLTALGTPTFASAIALAALTITLRTLLRSTFLAHVVAKLPR